MLITDDTEIVHELNFQIGQTNLNSFQLILDV